MLSYSYTNESLIKFQRPKFWLSRRQKTLSKSLVTVKRAEYISFFYLPFGRDIPEISGVWRVLLFGSSCELKCFREKELQYL